MSSPRHLPHGLNQIAGAAGVEVALKIALSRGGSRMLIPAKAEGSVLADLVGIDAARLISQHLAGERIEIPQARRLLSDWLKAMGWSQERRAMALKTARRTIQYWDAGKTPSLQSDLFV